VIFISNIFCTIKFRQKNHNNKKLPYTKILGDKDTLMMKFGLESDELEKMISSKKYPRRKR